MKHVVPDFCPDYPDFLRAGDHYGYARNSTTRMNVIGAKEWCQTAHPGSDLPMVQSFEQRDSITAGLAKLGITAYTYQNIFINLYITEMATCSNDQCSTVAHLTWADGTRFVYNGTRISVGERTDIGLYLRLQANLDSSVIYGAATGLALKPLCQAACHEGGLVLCIHSFQFSYYR